MSKGTPIEKVKEYYIMTIIHFLRSLKIVFRQNPLKLNIPYTLFIVRWNTQYGPKSTDCRSTDVFLTYFEAQLTDVPTKMFHVQDFWVNFFPKIVVLIFSG